MKVYVLLGIEIRYNQSIELGNVLSSIHSSLTAAKEAAQKSFVASLGEDRDEEGNPLDWSGHGQALEGFDPDECPDWLAMEDTNVGYREYQIRALELAEG